MKMVSFVRDLVVEQVPCVGINDEEIRYHVGSINDFGKLPRWEDKALITECKTGVAPIVCISEGFEDEVTKELRTKNTYIAYSEKVEKLLEMPFSAIQRRVRLLETLNRSLEADRDENLLLYKKLRRGVVTASPWQRFKYFLTGDASHLS